MGSAMAIPPWLSLLVAGAVIVFAFYRLYLAFGGPSDEERAKVRHGMLKMPRRQHAAIGIIFLIVASALFATSFGFNPFRADKTEKPTPAPEPPRAGTALPVR
jgi:hypothetical protein